MTALSNSADGAMLSPQATQIETASGRFVDLANPDPETIVLEDIAQALALTCRYGGHVRRFYSVAEHAVLVHDLMRWRIQQAAPHPFEREILLGALFHDAAEAFLGDVVAPLKFALRDGRERSTYDRLTIAMERAIAVRFGLSFAELESPAVRNADMWALRIEASELTASGGAEWRWPGSLPLNGQLPVSVAWTGDLDPEKARLVWLAAVAACGVVA